jgi:hypothetical protein
MNEDSGPADGAPAHATPDESSLSDENGSGYA